MYMIFLILIELLAFFSLFFRPHAIGYRPGT